MSYRKETDDVFRGNIKNIVESASKLLGYGVSNKKETKKEDVVEEFSDEEREILASELHQRWVKDAIDADWAYGDDNAGEKVSPDIMGWNNLSDIIKKKYYVAVDTVIPELEKSDLVLAGIIPKTYRKGKSQEGNFVFVSYSHRDSEWVYPILKGLYEINLRFWYDTEIRLGDKWDEHVLEEIEDSKCVGAIVFLSEYLAKSDACAKELKILLSKGKEFVCMSVNKNSDSPEKLFINGCIDPTKLYDAILKSESASVNITECSVPSVQEVVERAKIMRELFPSNKLWSPPPSSPAMFKRLAEAFRKVGAIDDEASLSEQLNIEDSVVFGTYPIRDRYDATVFINGEGTLPLKNEWVILKVDQGRTLLLSKHPVTAERVYAEKIDEKLKKFRESCFSKDELEILTSGPRLLTEDEFDHYIMGKKKNNCLSKCRPNPKENNSNRDISWWILKSDNTPTTILEEGKKNRLHSKGHIAHIRAVAEVTNDGLVNLRE